MMTLADITDALKPFLVTFGVKFEAAQWEQYGLALKDVSPGDLDDAIADLRKTHAFRNAPLPAEILERCDVHRKRRYVNTQVVEPFIKADPKDGEWKTHTIPGLGSVRMFVLPDDHPALPRYACFQCKDTGWEEQSFVSEPYGKSVYYRCHCRKTNPVIAQQRDRQAAYIQKRDQRRAK